MAHGEVDGVLLIGIDGVGAAVHQQTFTQREFPTVDFHLPREVEKHTVAEKLVRVGPVLIAIEFQRVAECDIQIRNRLIING